MVNQRNALRISSPQTCIVSWKQADNLARTLPIPNRKPDPKPQPKRHLDLELGWGWGCSHDILSGGMSTLCPSIGTKPTFLEEVHTF
eukprot:3570051-Amphidinium_carterae.1